MLKKIMLKKIKLFLLFVLSIFLFTDSFAIYCDQVFSGYVRYNKTAFFWDDMNNGTSQDLKL
jgi:hypothetical protein